MLLVKAPRHENIKSIRPDPPSFVVLLHLPRRIRACQPPGPAHPYRLAPPPFPSPRSSPQSRQPLGGAPPERADIPQVQPVAEHAGNARRLPVAAGFVEREANPAWFQSRWRSPRAARCTLRLACRHSVFMKAKACRAMSSLSDQMSRQAATMLARAPPAAEDENASKAIVLSYPIRPAPMAGPDHGVYSVAQFRLYRVMFAQPSKTSLCRVPLGRGSLPFAPLLQFSRRGSPIRCAGRSATSQPSPTS